MMPRAAPLLTAADMRAAEASWFAAGHDSFALMRKAAAAVAGAAADMLPADGRVLVVAGPGNNGGDGLVAAAMLRALGHQVTVAALARRTWRGDAARAAAGWGLPLLGPDDPWPDADLVIDALFGIGLARPLEGAAAALVARMNACAAPKLAIDLPSGIDSDTGAVLGAAVMADRTVTFHTGKPGHWLLPGRLHRGALSIADIGLPPAPARLWLNGPGLWRLPVPDADTHKYARGGALIWSGPELATGASRLAARGSLRAGAGAATLVGEAAALRVHAAHVTAIMLREGDAQAFARLLGEAKWRAACVGPGAGQGARCVAGAALQSGKALVLDADALTAFGGEVEHHLSRLIARHPRPVLLTPHEGEFARLFPQLSGSKLARARDAAQQPGAVVVLKGGDSVIAAPEGRAAINANAPPWLATAGSGDVLAGIATGLLAQGMQGFEAASAATFLHGALGEALGPGLIADDLTGPAFRAVLSSLFAQQGDP